MIFVGKG